MALTTGSAATAARPTLEPYYARLTEIDGGYHLANDGGRPIGRIRVYDDRQDGETGIHVQVTQGHRGGKVAVLHFDSLEGYDELIEALSTARAQMWTASRAKP